MNNYLVITGGSRGIGESIIATFLQAGWKVLNLSRTNCNLPDVKNINVDLINSDSIIDNAAAILAEMKNVGKISLVHNAALMQSNEVSTLNIEELRQDFEINIISPVALNKLLIPFMQPGSSIIYIGSTLSEMAVANFASYVIAKHAMIGLMRATCQDLAGKDITTSCICPGFTDTPMVQARFKCGTLEQTIKNIVTFGRLIQPQEIADLVYFSATHPVVNGAILHANLGQRGS